MIRPTTAADIPAILSLANAAIGFETEELAQLNQALAEYLDGHSANAPSIAPLATRQATSPPFNSETLT